MSRLLKIICNTLIVLAVAIAVALLLPPVMGVTTTVIDSQGIRSNLPVGSVTYSRKVTADNLKKGDFILVESKNEAYAYDVISVDIVTKKMVVRNAFDKSAEEKELKITSGVSRISFTIPFIGFAVVAMQTVEGMIVIGLIVLFIIILYILSEVWKKKPDEEEAPVIKEKPKKEKPVSSSSAKTAPETSPKAPAGTGEAAAKAAAGAVPAAGAAALSGSTDIREAPEPAKTAEMSASEMHIEDDELTEEEFQRILALATAREGEVPEAEIVSDDRGTFTELQAGGEAGSAKPQTGGEAESAKPADAGAKTAAPEAAGPETEAAPNGEKPEKTKDLGKKGASDGAENDGGTAAKEPAGTGGKKEKKGSGKKSVPPHRHSLDEMLEYAKKGGGDPEFRKDDVSGLDVVDYSSFL